MRVLGRAFILVKMMNDQTTFVDRWRSSREAREQCIAEMKRDLSNTGSLDGFNDFLSLLAGILTKPEVIALFAELQQSKRAECEWKQEFLAIFINVKESDLPPPIIDEQKARKFVDDARKQNSFERPDPGYPDAPF